MVNAPAKTKYFVVTRSISLANLGKMSIENELNTAAADGWEFVSMTTEATSNQIIYFFKRTEA